MKHMLALLCAFFALTHPALADDSQAKLPPFEVEASHLLLLDMNTGAVLASKNASETMYPSSMTKLMTLYVLFEELKKGAITLSDTFKVSKEAWAMQGSKMFVPIDADVSVRDLISGIATQSGNDACIVVAEGISGSEKAFAARMNETAQRIGMRGSNFMNASGWPDDNHYVTARDLAILSARLVQDFSDYYPYFAEKEFTYNNIRQFNRNTLIGHRSLGVDGLKTGHTEAAGYGITLSAKKPNSERRLILVINGLSSSKARIKEGEALLRWGFQNFKNVKVAQAGAEITKAKTWLGQEDTVSLTVAEDVWATKAVADTTPVEAKAMIDLPVPAPIAKGQEIAVLHIGENALGANKKVPLVAMRAVKKQGALARIPAMIADWLGL